ncbi:MAG: hypothetical protein ACTTKH_00300 [Treponema sp.]
MKSFFIILFLSFLTPLLAVESGREVIGREYVIAFHATVDSDEVAQNLIRELPLLQKKE